MSCTGKKLSEDSERSTTHRKNHNPTIISTQNALQQPKNPSDVRKVQQFLCTRTRFGATNESKPLQCNVSPGLKSRENRNILGTFRTVNRRQTWQIWEIRSKIAHLLFKIPLT